MITLQHIISIIVSLVHFSGIILQILFVKQGIQLKPQEIKLVDSELPKVSLITPTYNRPDFFKLAILNLIVLTIQETNEVIIVDDSNNNDTENQLPPEEHRGKYNITYLRVNEEEGSNSRV